MMEETKHPPNAPMVEALVRPMDFSIGCITAMNGQDVQVAIMINPKPPPPTPLDALLFDDWDELLVVVRALLEAGTTVWGMPPGAVSLTSGPPPTAH